MRKEMVNDDRIVIEAEFGRLEVDRDSGKVNVAGLFDEPRDTEVPDQVLSFLKSQGYEPIVLGDAIVTPTLLGVNGNDVIACDVEPRGAEIEKFESIRVPFSKIDPVRLACLPLRYYFSTSRTGAVFVTGYEAILKSLLEGRVSTLSGNKYVEVPKRRWAMVGGETRGGGLDTELRERIDRLEERVERIESLLSELRAKLSGPDAEELKEL